MPPPQHPQIAATLREAMERKGLTAGDVAEKLMGTRASSVAYNWVAGRNAPAPKYRAPLAKLLGISVEDLKPRDDVTYRTNGAAAVTVKAPARDMRSAEQQLSFTILSGGQARLRVDVTGPLERISPILLQLMQHPDLIDIHEADAPETGNGT